jgi:hypothetical protein
MDKYKFLNALSNNEYLDKLDVQQLNEVVESFPYFQSAYLLLAQKIIHQPQPYRHFGNFAMHCRTHWRPRNAV